MPHPSPEPQGASKSESTDSEQGVAAPPPWEILHQVMLSLMRVRETEEGVRLSLAAVRDLFSSRWVALYRPEGKEYVCRGVLAPEGDHITSRLPGESVEALSGTPRACPAGLRGGCSPEAEIVAPVDLGEGRALFLLGPRATGTAYSAGDLAFLHRLLECCASALQNTEFLDRLRSQVFIDFLTECYNRRAFEEHLEVEMVRASRYRRPLTLVLVDIDHFKWINDGLGHRVGDYALQRVGATLLRAFRSTDRVCRYGGDEFAVLFPETAKEEVLRLAERLRLRIQGLFPDASLSIPLTVSLGIAAFPVDARGAEELVRAADHALYQAKSAGRNRVALA